VENGDKTALRELDAHESNLHHACRLACQLEAWPMAAKATHGLGVLYGSDGRLAQWESLLEQLTPLCVERTTQKSLPGREEFWRVVTGQGARLSQKNQRLFRAEKLQELCVQWDREKAKASLGKQPDELEVEDKESYRGLADSLYHLSSILREQGTPSIKVDEEAVALRERLGEKEPASAWAYEIGESYTEIPEIRELAQAERWLKRGLDLKREEDRVGRAKCLAQLGRIAWVRFNDARKSERPEPELRRYLNDARMYYQAALEHDPPEDYATLARHHEELGHISQAVGDFERALPHYREAIRYYDLCGNLQAASSARFNLGIDLRNAGRLAEARKLALTAREGFQRLGKSETEMLQRTNALLEHIDQKLHGKKGLPAH
jgi:tetratricopeptide (TPR) repeat protein